MPLFYNVYKRVANWFNQMSQRMFSFNGFCSAKLWNAWYDCDTKAFYFHGKKGLIQSVSLLECGQRPLWFISCDAQPWLRPLQQLSVTSSVKHLRISLQLCNLTLQTLFLGLKSIFFRFPPIFLKKIFQRPSRLFLPVPPPQWVTHGRDSDSPCQHYLTVPGLLTFPLWQAEVSLNSKGHFSH